MRGGRGLNFEHTFSTMCSPPAPKHLSLAQNAFFLRTKSVCLQHNKCIRLLFGRWFRKTPKRMETEEREFNLTSYHLRIELIKGQKQGRDERTQQEYPTSVAHLWKCRVVFLCSFISALFLSFFQGHPYSDRNYVR